LKQAGIADGFCGLVLNLPAVEGCSAHVLALVDGMANAAVRSGLLATLERLADGSVLSNLVLRALGEAMGLLAAKMTLPLGM
jgi:hypothetical protein